MRPERERQGVCKANVPADESPALVECPLPNLLVRRSVESDISNIRRVEAAPTKFDRQGAREILVDQELRQ